MGFVVLNESLESRNVVGQDETCFKFELFGELLQQVVLKAADPEGILVVSGSGRNDGDPELSRGLDDLQGLRWFSASACKQAQQYQAGDAWFYEF